MSSSKEGPFHTPESRWVRGQGEGPELVGNGSGNGSKHRSLGRQREPGEVGSLRGPGVYMGGFFFSGFYVFI